MDHMFRSSVLLFENLKITTIMRLTWKRRCSPLRFQRHVLVLDQLDVMLKTGDQFVEKSKHLISSNNKECTTEAADSVKLLDSIGQEQYNLYRRDVLNIGSITLNKTIKTILGFSTKQRNKR